jgi:hypothetical protein
MMAFIWLEVLFCLAISCVDGFSSRKKEEEERTKRANRLGFFVKKMQLENGQYTKQA